MVFLLVLLVWFCWGVCLMVFCWGFCRVFSEGFWGTFFFEFVEGLFWGKVLLKFL